MSGPTVCQECKHVHTDSKRGYSWTWLCTKHPRLKGFGYVTADTWDKDPPFLRCNDVNAGACPLFEEDPGKQMNIGV